MIRSTISELVPTTGAARATLWLRALPAAGVGDADILSTLYPLAPALIHAVGKVAVSAAGNGTPACDKIPGLTTMMYIAVRKVVMPATISVFVREPAARMPKKRSSVVMS